MSSSGKIVNLVNPTDGQDAATRSYVDNGVANATAIGNNAQSTANTAQTTANTAVANMATSSSVSSAITTALGSSGAGYGENRPTVQRGDTDSAWQYLTFFNDTDFPGDGSTKRALMRCDGDLYYKPSTNTLAAGTFSGAVSASSGSFSGMVGIGTTTPQVMLDVKGAITATSVTAKDGDFYTNGWITGAVIVANGSVNYDLYTGTARYFNLSGSIGSVGAQYIATISIVSENSIWIKGPHLWVTSDQRIKKNIVNLNADKMMNIFRTIRPISFDFIDPIKNNNKKHFGFIAQEVNEVLPEGISLNTDVIPNNMMKGGITKPSETDETPCFTLKPDDTDITLQYLLLTTDKPISFDISNSYSSTNVYKFKIYGGKEWSKEHDIYIRSEYNVTDDKYTYVIGLKKEAYDVVITEPTLFVYGQYVYDLHILDHDTIYTVATAALQEVDKQQQADKARIAELENHVSILEAKVSEQQSLINDILERLKKVERV